jgi:hypothetical protein
MEPTYENIKPLIIEEIWDTTQINQVKVKFKAINQNEPIESMGMAMEDPEVMQKKMNAEIAKMMASGAAVGVASNTLGSLTGVPGAGSAISSAASMAGVGYQMDPSKFMIPEMTPERKQKTVVDAFKNLATYYVWENGNWTYKEPNS